MNSNGDSPLYWLMCAAASPRSRKITGMRENRNGTYPLTPIY